MGQGNRATDAMAYSAALIIIVLATVAEARVGNSSESSFCTETKECLLFDLVCKTSNYEVRYYNAARWVSTDEQSYFLEMASIMAFRRLYKYITGSNTDGVKIDMTAPVLIKHKVDKKMFQSATFTLSFLLPSEFQENPPEPTDAKVYFTDLPDTTVYVTSFQGWITTITAKKNGNQLATNLDEVNATYVKDFRYAVGYNRYMTWRMEMQ